MNAPDPYKGLRPFEDAESDVPFFFGRDRDREVIVANLMASRLTVLYGETGVGKSSVLRAGVAHHLRGLSDPLAVVVFDAWKDDPAEALSAALGEAAGVEPMGSLVDTVERCTATLGGEVFVLLDGTEEFFLYHDGRNGGGDFVEELADAVRRPGLRASFLLALREDALAKLDRFKGPIPNVLGNYLRLDYLDREAGRRAILGPLERYNALVVGPDEQVEIEPALVERVLDDVAAGKVELGQAGRGAVEGRAADARIETPFLQLVMRRLWEAEQRAGSRNLRLSTLEELGGAEQIVRDHVETALSSLDPAEKDAAAAVFNHLVTPSGTKIAHAVPDLARYAGVSEAGLAPVLATLTSERIVRPVAGEDGGPPRYEIYHDVLGEAVLAWRAEHEAERQVGEERERAHRRHRRLLIALGAAALLLALMAGVAIFAFTQRSEARSQASKARAGELEATAVSLLPVDPQRSLQLAIEAAEAVPSPRAETVLRQSLLAARERAVLPAAGPVTVARYSPDGRRILTASTDGRARLYDSSSHAVLRTFDHGGPVLNAAFGPRGVIATAGADGRVITWAESSGRRLRALQHGGPVRDVEFGPRGLVVTAGGRTAKVWRVSGGIVHVFPHDKPVVKAFFSPDGRSVITVSNDRWARLFDVRSGRFVRRFDQGGRVRSADLTQDGRLLVTAGENGTATLWNARSGRRLGELEHREAVLDAVFSPNGKRVATVSADWTGRVWDVNSLRLVAQLVGHANVVRHVAFSPDGRFLVTASADRTARVWSTEDGREHALLAGHRGSVLDAAFSPDGAKVLTASDDRTARIWNPQTTPRLGVLVRRKGPVALASYLGGGKLVLLAGPGRTASVVDADSRETARTYRVGAPVTAAAATPDGRLVAVAAGSGVTVFGRGRVPVAVLRSPAPVTAVAFAPNGQKIATAGSDGIGRLWTADGRLLRKLTGHRAALTDVAFSPDGARVATSSRDRTARVWDVPTGKTLLILRGHTDDVTSVTFSPDGRLVLTAGLDRDARLWDAGSGARVQVLRWHVGRVSDASFSPNGRWIVTAGPTTAQLWQPGGSNWLLPFGLAGHKRPLTSATFDPTGRRILTAGRDGTVRTYTCEVCGGLGELVGLAKARIGALGRSLTLAEQRRYVSTTNEGR